MLRIPHHPMAFLTFKRNIKPGLEARTKIISFLELKQSTTRKISKETELSYKAVLYHLHLLEKESILRHRGKRLFVWELTGIGQQKLITET
jgi:predicted transcriptional regulator